MNGQNLTKFCIDIIIDKIYVGVVNCHFLQICNRVTALNDVRIQFLFNILRMKGQNLTKFCIHIYHSQDLCRDCKLSYFANLQQSYGP